MVSSAAAVSIVLYQGIKGSRDHGSLSAGFEWWYDMIVTDVVGLAAGCRLQYLMFQGGDRERKRSQARLLVV